MHVDGPMLVLAGPGSGKTLTITNRVSHLINGVNINPANILVITFTKAAAMEMKERFMRDNPDCKGVTFGTFHAVFFMMLKAAYNYSASNIVTDEEKLIIMKDLIRRMNLEYEDENEFIGQIYAEISLIKNSRIELSYYYPKNCGTDEFRRLYAGYEKALRKNRKIDFDDMLIMTYELLKERNDILKAWQNKYRYILIDEFQDVNQIQYDITRMLAGDRANLFMVGDDDQSIYRFRGSKPKIMLGVEKDYPSLKKVFLSNNYRCPKNIANMAIKLVSNNEMRFKKTIEPKRPDGKIIRHIFDDERGENQYIISQIKEYMSKGVSSSDIAVLFRVNTQCRLLTEMLMDYNISYVARDVAPSIYNHWLARDMFAYLDIAHGSRKREDFMLIINRPKRYISRESLEYSTVAFDVWQRFYSEQPWVEKRIEDLQRDLNMIKKMKPYAALNYIRRAIGYDEFIEEYAEQRHIKAEDMYDILDELMESAKPYESYEAWLNHIEEYTRALKERKNLDYGKDGVQLMTLHGAKGLEFKTVFIMDINEGVLPYKKAALPEDIEEERRMLYVGMTRSMSDIHLLSLKKMHGKNCDESRFIVEAGVK